jgi:PAS domain S-box-containing protein
MSSKLNHKNIFNTVDIGIISTNAKCRVTVINQYAMDILALDEESCIGSPIADILPSIESIIQKCIETSEIQFVNKTTNKNTTFVGKIVAIKKKSRTLGAVFSFQSVKAFELPDSKIESYKLLNEEIEAIFRSSSYGYWLCDGEGTVLKMNKAAEMHTGIEAREIIGKKAWYLVEKGFVDHSVTGEVVKSKRRVRTTQHLIKKNKHLMVTATPLFDPGGKLSWIVVNTRDITKLTAIRQELNQSRLIAKKAQDELSELSMQELHKQKIIAESENMKQVIRAALKLSAMDTSEILLLGESGVGKGLLAEFIHKNSSRKGKPFVHINCMALPESLLEAELFGYKKGAFTGALDQGKIGIIELAQGGTLFLDEIGDIPFSIQGKLLTYLDNHTIRPLGGLEVKTINCVIIAATNRNLENMVKQKRFRHDLFYRLNTFTLKTPPLRERADDVFELANFYLKKYNDEYGLKRKFSSRVLKKLQSYSFPGNVRELKGLFKKAVVLSDRDVLDDFILTIIGNDCDELNRPNGEKCSLNAQVQRFEEGILKAATLHCKTTREMAKFLGVNQSSVVRKLKKYKLPGPIDAIRHQKKPITI